ncbi:hypothetical protein [Bacillus safensis]|uniref:hypothetical protein n=1 Tax=Bacillus safensis TaxID=561879 RepID=UPI0021E5C83E|nr:hypothetical protein [Bacillus safensis]UXO88804.1 hypothetical protein N7921_03625 [Bacillus safensis]
MLKDVVIVCISGFRFTGDPESGVKDLRDTLRDNLVPLGVPEENIFHRSWHKGREGDPGRTPNVNDIIKQIDERSTNPSYLALIGHSYGGWAACRVSRKTKNIPDFIGLLDPVFGVDNSMENRDKPRAKNIKNWSQDNAISIVNDCLPIITPCSSPSAGFACGYKNVPDAENNDVEYLMDWEGNPLKKDCVFYKIKKKATHMNMDDNRRLHRYIYEKIQSDINNMIIAARNSQILLFLMKQN